MKKNKVYIGGALFKEGDIKQRIYEADELRKCKSLEVFNPIESPVNDKALLPTAEDIFYGDTKEVLKSKYILAELDEKIDEGLVAEMAIAWARVHTKHEIKKIMMENSTSSLYDALQEWLDQVPDTRIVAHASDIRLKDADKYHGVNIPIGYNQYVIGMLFDQYHPFFSSADEAIEWIKGMEKENEEKTKE